MSVLGQLRAAREYMYPTRKTSAFLEKGVLTPEEFVLAGDELVFKCPTWSWECGDPSKSKPYLPKDKQYLVTRTVPCQQRVSSMENTFAMEGDDDEGDWLVSSVVKPRTDEEIEDEFDILDEEGEIIEKQDETGTKPDPDEEEDEYADMDGFNDENVLEDDDAAVVPTTTQSDNLIKVRTYDLSITYDKYYQTPRVWMTGYDEAQQPLTGKQMMEDVISDYANRTVTMEHHPHVAGTQASIHPCQHGKVMKTIVKNLIKASSQGDGDGDEGPSV
eukprot:CAMPEP_0202448464 /NCGR_PEP_ID=MMETSP1360-20130828/7279_1 /ASSEMBLY_ACC=CAM_ASM_000848 /TAXON_ID=515479 /ORGANISM="Licmophora paradoxa, Strain CCMP2313" /LENGTH=273 /DNA_ID=CAMNT_0049066047 /DNA_START=33 /DNA_END=851 /DNA_ORIENTATION=+